MKVPVLPTDWDGSWEPPGDWVDSASCAQTGFPEAWFPEMDGTGTIDNGTLAMARRICRQCPVRLLCLDYALRHESSSYRFGIYGGLTPGQRYKLSRRQARDEAQRNRPDGSGRAPQGRGSAQGTQEGLPAVLAGGQRLGRVP